MNQDEVLKLFEQEAELLDKTFIRQGDMIRQLAQLIADSRHQLSEQQFAILVRIGATLQKKTQSQNRARSEIATTMRDSIRDTNNQG